MRKVRLSLGYQWDHPRCVGRYVLIIRSDWRGVLQPGDRPSNCYRPRERIRSTLCLQIIASSAMMTADGRPNLANIPRRSCFCAGVVCAACAACASGAGLGSSASGRSAFSPSVATVGAAAAGSFAAGAVGAARAPSSEQSMESSPSATESSFAAAGAAVAGAVAAGVAASVAAGFSSEWSEESALAATSSGRRGGGPSTAGPKEARSGPRQPWNRKASARGGTGGGFLPSWSPSLEYRRTIALPVGGSRTMLTVICIVFASSSSKRVRRWPS